MTCPIYLDNDTFERDGRTFRVTFPRDDDHGAPWEECDGHGPVSDWTTRDKAPGELVLCSDRHSKRYYDFQEACKIALRDGWGSANCRDDMTRRQRAATAARDDYEYLRRWCNDDWCYIGVVVELLDDEGEETDESESLWGIESDAYGYLADTAHDLADCILSRVKAEQEQSDILAARALEQSRPDMYGPL